MRGQVRWKWLAILLIFLLAERIRAEDYYFVMVFGSQRLPFEPNISHTWATFVRASEMPDCQFFLEAHTISWLPASGKVRIGALLPEPGHNFDLDFTIHWALSKAQRISMWGPYQVTPELYVRALRQKALLESGTVRYEMVDWGRRSNRVSNCFHAVASVVEGNRLRIVSPHFGQNASYRVVRAMEPWIVLPERKHEWISTALGLDCYPIIRRDLEHPRSGFLGTAAGRILD